MTTATRLPAAERRQAIVETAIRLFTESSYRGTTTAEIARAAGVSEPILYRHFDSKLALYLAAIDHVWEQARSAWERTLASTPDAWPAVEEIGREHVSVHSSKLQLAELWVQALAEAADDVELREHLRGHLREVHDFTAALFRRGQGQGVIAADRDVAAEAWVFLAGGMLGMIGRRLGVLDDEELTAVRNARLAWLRA